MLKTDRKQSSLSMLTTAAPNGEALLFSFVNDGCRFDVVAKTTAADVRTARVRILLKTRGERPVLLTKLDESWTADAAEQFVREECIEA